MCCWPKDRQGELLLLLLLLLLIIAFFAIQYRLLTSCAPLFLILANDGNGNCDDPYDERCVDKDVADNTDLCYVDLQRGNQTTDFDTSGILVYSGDGDNGEGAIHCHGLAWSNDDNDHTSRYRGNNLIFVSMYDHMYQRGYVKNIPGAPMCGVSCYMLTCAHFYTATLIL